MGIVTIEGVVEGDHIRIRGNVRLPDKARVYIILPDVQVEQVARISSPRLACPEQVVDFILEVLEEPPSAGV